MVQAQQQKCCQHACCTPRFPHKTASGAAGLALQSQCETGARWYPDPLCVGMQKLIGFVNETCSPRLHWAKAGWPRYLSCFDGSVAYPQTWCDFGCAVQVIPSCHGVDL